MFDRKGFKIDIIMEQIIAYKPKCGCKNHTFRTKRACLAHEKWCIYNPENHACPTCKYNDGNISDCTKKVLDKYDYDGSFVLKETVAKHCPYWEYNEDFKRK